MEIEDIRAYISELLENHNPDAVGDLEGMCVYKSMYDVFGDCASYVFYDIFALPIVNLYDAYVYCRDTWQEVQEIEVGDLIVYYSDEESAEHFGIALSNGLVRSKFGYAHVYDHPLWAVPDFYGNVVVCYRKV